MRKRICVVSMLAVMAACGDAVAAAPGAEDEFNEQRTKSAMRALDSVPFLVDHPDIMKALKTKILGQRAAMDDATNPAPAAPQKRMITISPGDDGPTNEVDTVQGYPTTISFIDRTGAPWPIQWEAKTAVYQPQTQPSQPPETSRAQEQSQSNETYTHEASVVSGVSLGHGFDYQVPVKGKGGNTINIRTLSPSPRGGMNIMLEDGKSVIPFVLRAAGPEGGVYDAKVVVKIMALGPQAEASKAVPADNTPMTGTREMDDMLNGHPPAAAIPLDVVGLSPDRIRAWKLKNFVYIRTDVTILNPQPTAGASGETASIFRIRPSPVVLISDNGRTSSIHLSEAD